MKRAGNPITEDEHLLVVRFGRGRGGWIADIFAEGTNSFAFQSCSV